MPERLPKADLIALVRKIMAAEGTEEEIDQMISTLEANVPHPEVTDLIFYPPDHELTPEEVVELALAYKATPMGPGE
jgi:hypothetical protein